MGTKIPPVTSGGSTLYLTSLGAAAADMSIGGLLGDSAGGYLITGSIVTIAAALNYTLQFNGGVPAGAWSSGTYNMNATTGNIASPQSLYIGSTSVANAGNLSFWIEMGSKQGDWRAYKCTAFFQRTGSPASATALGYSIAGQFKMASQITTITVHSDAANSIDAGSYMYIATRGMI